MLNHITTECRTSHPAWVCGLKLRYCHNKSWRLGSHPAWVCGLKQISNAPLVELVRVTPCVGVWIETASSSTSNTEGLSHTLRGCVD